MVGNMFWNIEAINFICIPSPLKLFKTISGEFLKASSNTICFLRVETTSLASEKFNILKDSVGPLGNLGVGKLQKKIINVMFRQTVHEYQNLTYLQNLRYIPNSVLVNMDM